MLFLTTDFGDLWNEFWEYMSDTYFNITATGYEHLGFTPTATTVSVIVFGMAFGIFIAAIAAMLEKNVAGTVVRALLSAEAADEQSAKTLDALGLQKKRSVRNALRRNLVVRKIVKAVPVSDAGDAAFLRDIAGKPDLDRYAYFIPEELKNHAYFRFDKRGTNWFAVVATIVLSFIFIFVLLALMPDFLQLCDNIVASLAG